MSADREDKPTRKSTGPKDPKAPYRSPPAESRWKPGQSGNPRGRPPGSKNRPKEPRREDYRDMIIEEGRRLMVISDANGPLELSTARAVVRMQGVCALKGGVRAQRNYLDRYERAEKEELRDREVLLQQITEAKLDWHRTVQSYRKRGLKPPKPPIDPDDIFVDPEALSIRLRPPATPEETERWTAYVKAAERWLSAFETTWARASRRRRRKLRDEFELVQTALPHLRAALEGSRQAMLSVEDLEPHLAALFPEESESSLTDRPSQ